MNQIFVIQPYYYNGSWVFDDPEVELIREPFVSGIPEMIEALTEQILHAREGFRLLFSAEPFPEYQVKLNWVREEIDGHWYTAEGTDQEGWLCPAMFKYFDAAPSSIYAKAESSITQHSTHNEKTVAITRTEIDAFLVELDRGDLNSMRAMLTDLKNRFND